MIQIDGSQGEGGGQVLRSSLAMSLVTGRPFVIENIRAGRKKPGLMRQHLTAVNAATEAGRAEVTGAAIGSMRLEFRPGRIAPGDHVFSVGTAGSATLVLQTVLPALLLADGESNLTLEGGTHNPFAPPFDFLTKTYLPLVRSMGPKVEARLVHPGFYPAGGGQLTVRVEPAERLERLELLERGDIRSRRVRAMVANLPRHIAERECQTIAEKTAWDESCFSVEEVRGSRGPGNVVLIELESDSLTEVFTGFGQIGVPAEAVARRALDDARAYLAAGVPVGRYLADQLMLPLGIGAHFGTGGGAFRTMALSLHATTHIEVLRRFLEINIAAEQQARDDVMVRIG
ncbi:MAG: RNA 3'-terminal phosphate cyclase [Pirellulaceae bacterium]|nr:RNA 3'-terminal phosphate cyclase [Pirellulaceae bacterium]